MYIYDVHRIHQNILYSLSWYPHNAKLFRLCLIDQHFYFKFNAEDYAENKFLTSVAQLKT